MAIKSFREKWTKDEIAKYVQDYNILVLFAEDWMSREAIINIHSMLAESKKQALLEKIVSLFGGQPLNDVV